MSSLVDFEVFAACEDFAAAGEGARKGLLPRVHPDVVDQLVLGFEGTSIPHAPLPVARVVGLLRPTHVLHRDVGDDLMHRVEDLVAGLPRLRLLLVYPQARVLLLDRMADERVESTRSVRSHVHARRRVAG